MNDWQDRTRMLIGQAACETLLKARVAVFGIGGVGGYVCEALVRSGIGTFDLIDNDTVSVSNINRQIIATTKTIGRYKVDVMKERMLEINPAATVHTYRCFFLPGREGDFPFGQYDYIVDAVDTVTAKLQQKHRFRLSAVWARAISLWRGVLRLPTFMIPRPARWQG